MDSALSHPKGIFGTSTLTNTAQTVMTGARPVSGFRLIGGAAAETVIFRRAGAGAEYFRIPLAAGEKYNDDVPWTPDAGLEVLTADLAGDVSCVVHHVS